MAVQMHTAPHVQQTAPFKFIHTPSGDLHISDGPRKLFPKRVKVPFKHNHGGADGTFANWEDVALTWV